MEPVRAHRLVPVTRNFINAAIVRRSTSTSVGRVLVDAVAPSQNDRVMVVIKLIGEKISAGESVILSTVMSVVFVRGNGMPAKAAILRDVRRQLIVQTEKHGITIAYLHQFGREGPVISPQSIGSLIGKIRMKT